MGKLTINDLFNSYVSLPEGNRTIICPADLLLEYVWEKPGSISQKDEGYGNIKMIGQYVIVYIYIKSDYITYHRDMEFFQKKCGFKGRPVDPEGDAKMAA